MKAVIQAGGKGTRISSITGDTIPKPMLEVEGYPILYHQIMNLKRSGIKDIIIIIGHLGNVIEEYFGDGSKFGVNINYVREDPTKPLGTAGALYYLKDQLKEDFIFLLADVFIDIDFKKMEDFHLKQKADITLFTHPNSHPFDSDLVVSDRDNRVSGFDYKTNDRSKYFYHNNVNAGVMIFSPKVFNYINEPTKISYEKDLVVPLINKGKVVSYKSTEYAKDMGTPERYQRVSEDFRNGTTHSRNLSQMQKCFFLDRDGTINKYVGFLRHPEEMELLPTVSEAIKKLNNSEYLTIVISNQPVIARGESTVENLDNIHKKMETLLGQDGAYIDDLYYCPHHPDKGFPGEVPELKIKCECRKPGTGLIKDAVLKYNIDLDESVMIGDSTIDVECARRLGIPSILLKTGQAGEDKKYDVEPTYVAKDLLSAVNIVLEKDKIYGELNK
jgi:mannose-1-phosphate guanylyltransferase / phosphomannomutase